jgi:hypothetical protein
MSTCALCGSTVEPIDILGVKVVPCICRACFDRVMKEPIKVSRATAEEFNASGFTLFGVPVRIVTED